VIKRVFTVRNLVILLVVIITPFAISRLLGLKVAPPEVLLAAPPLFHIGTFAVTNALFTAWVVMIILIVAVFFATRYHPKDLSSASNSELVPGGFANLVEWIIDGLHGLTQSVAGSWTPRFFPIVMTIFLFVITSNWLGLMPGVGSIGLLEPAPLNEQGVTPLVANGHILTATPAPSPEEGYVLISFLRPPSTDLNFTLALALTAVGLCQYFGVKALRLSYFKRFADFSGFKQGAFMGVIMVFVGLLELVAELARIISFAFRLFGNIFAGEVLLMVMAFLIPYYASLPFIGLEIFVGFIQALVFMMLALVFMTVATIGHGTEEHS
jgi:F-type H+-transporting ATPase subunit a